MPIRIQAWNSVTTDADNLVTTVDGPWRERAYVFELAIPAEEC